MWILDDNINNIIYNCKIAALKPVDSEALHQEKPGATQMHTISTLLYMSWYLTRQGKNFYNFYT